MFLIVVAFCTLYDEVFQRTYRHGRPSDSVDVTVRVYSNQLSPDVPLSSICLAQFDFKLIVWCKIKPQTYLNCLLANNRSGKRRKPAKKQKITVYIHIT
jgi:hypothetical protein